MRRNKQFFVGVIVLAVAATQSVAAPKRSKKPSPAPETTDLRLLPASTFVTYDIGTLRMSGKSTADVSYNIGTLRLTGRSVDSTIHHIGTLRLTGAATVPVTYDAGTLSMMGKAEP
jgi:hypothetical protein